MSTHNSSYCSQVGSGSIYTSINNYSQTKSDNYIGQAKRLGNTRENQVGCHTGTTLFGLWTAQSMRCVVLAKPTLFLQNVDSSTLAHRIALHMSG